jgi:hypothetical protein
MGERKGRRGSRRGEDNDKKRRLKGLCFQDPVESYSMLTLTYCIDVGG